MSAAVQLNIQLGPYQLLSELGRGNYGIVYLAEKDGAHFAIKVPHDAEDRDYGRFRREAFTLARLSHPNLTKIIEISESDGKPFLVMELLKGSTLTEKLRTVTSFTEQKVLELAEAVASALSVIHRNHLIHRDVKPDNIMVCDDGSIRLIDLGMVADDEVLQQDSAGNVVLGSFQYVAPEQAGIIKRGVDARSDLYSLGITLYQASTGQLPFKSEDIDELLKAHASERVKPVIEVNPQMSRVSSAIIEKLLQKDPDDRYQSATGLIFDLRQLDKLGAAEGSLPALLGRNDRNSGMGVTPIEGRDSELQTLQNSIRAMTQGKGGAALVEAESGMGKSRLVREALERSRDLNLLILQAKCNDKANTSPLGTLRDALDSAMPILNSLPPKESDILLAEMRSAAADLAGGLSGVFSSKLAELLLPPGFVKGGEIGEEQVIVQAQEFINRLARTRNVVLYIDDIQWADEASLNFIDKVLTRISKSKIQLLTTIRKENEVDFQLTSAGRAILASQKKVTISLGPLQPKDIHAILKSALGGRDVAKIIVDKVAGASAGNPFLVQEITFALIDRGDLSLVGEQWSLSEASFADLDLSQTVYRMILARASQLTTGQREALTFAAIIGGTFDLALLSKLLGVDTAAVENLLRGAHRINFIEPGTKRETYSFSHDKIREALLQDVSPEKVKATYGLLAKHIQADAESNPDLILTLAHYFRQSDWSQAPKPAFCANLKAGILLLERYSFREAHQVLSNAEAIGATTTLERDEIFRLHLALGKACVDLARHDEMFSHFALARESAQDKIDRAKVEVLEFKGLYSAGKFPEAFEQMKVSLDTLGHSFPRAGIVLILCVIGNILLTYLHTLFPVFKGRLLKPGREEELKTTRMIAEVLSHSMMLAYNLGDMPSGAYLTFHIWVVAFSMGDSAELALAMSGIGTAWAFTPFKKMALYHLNQGEVIVRKLADPGLAARFQLGKMWVLEFIGETRAAEKLAIEIIPVCARYLTSEYNSLLLGDISAQYMSRGMVREGASFNLRYLPDLDRTQNVMMMAYIRLALYGAGVAMDGGLEDHERFLREYKELYAKIPESKTSKSGALTKYSIVVDQRFDDLVFDEELEQSIAGFLDCKMEDHHWRLMFCKIGYIRLWQLDRATDEAAKTLAKRNLEKAIAMLSFRAGIAIWSCHLNVIQAGLARFEKKFDRAKKYLDKAEDLAEEAGSNLGLYFAAVERARLEEAKNSPARTMKEAKHAYSLAIQFGLNARARQLKDEFKFLNEKQAGSISAAPTISATGSFISPGSNSGSFMSGAGGVRLTLNEKRLLKSLLQVNQASVVTANPMDQIRAVLDEILSVFAAERAFVLVWDEKKNELELKGGRTSTKADLVEIVGYSTTVIKSVLEKREPLVTTGSDDLKNLGSKSAILHDLRSILCVPLFLKESFKGILYIDSRMTRGLFNQEDVGVLIAISTHIAVALESSRVAVVEAERREMTKDLEVSAAVQEMLLPIETPQQDSRFSLVSLYKPAVQCGGDWWWSWRSKDKLIVFVGDVTGHGTGSAMITAAIAMTFRFFETRCESEDFGKILSMINDQFTAFAHGKYWMTGIAYQIDFQTNELKWWAAGGPHIIRITSDGTLDFIGDGSSPLGSGEWPTGPAAGRAQLAPGDRLYLATDGITEMDTKRGKMLGDKKFSDILRGLSTTPIDSLSQELWTKLNGLAAPGPQNDDITFVAVELTKKDNAA